MRKSYQKGFTLIEILLVVAIISILSSIVVIAINPGRQMANSRNTTRSADIVSIINAVNQYELDHNGIAPSGLSATPVNVSTISNSLVPVYLSAIPLDPLGGQYKISLDSNNRSTVSAPAAELGVVISITR